jgi:hypothetical protein
MVYISFAQEVHSFSGNRLKERNNGKAAPDLNLNTNLLQNGRKMARISILDATLFNRLQSLANEANIF